MNRKKLAVLLAAVLTAGSMPLPAVSAAEFTDAELTEEAFADDFVSEEAEAGDALTAFESAEAVTEETESPVFMDEAAVEADASEAYTARIHGGYVSKEAFEHWEETGETPEDFGKTDVTTGNLDEFFAKLEGANTGYVLLGFESFEGGYGDFRVPSRVKAGIVQWETPRFQSISTDTGVVVRGDIMTPGRLSLKGNGAFKMCCGVIDGILTGEGSDDTFVLGEWSHVRGIQKVENMVFTQNTGLEIEGGPSEFFNIVNESTGEDRNVHFNVQGYAEDRIPVFHKNPELGIQSGIDEEGNRWEYPAGVSVGYVKDMNTEDWQWIDIGAGKQAMKFAMSDGDALDMLRKCWVDVPEGMSGYAIDMDGKTFIHNENTWMKNYHIRAYKSSAQMSAKDAFTGDGQWDIDWENCIEEVIDLPTLSQTLRAVKAYKDSEGWFSVHLAEGAKPDTALTVPDNVRGMKYFARVDWNEAAETGSTRPVVLSAVQVPAGKVVMLVDIKTEGGNLNITGDGNLELLHCMLNQNVTAKNVVIKNSAVKSLKCEELITDGGMVTVTDYLKFDRGGFGTDLLAKSGAVLEMGELDTPKYLDRGASVSILREHKGSQRAELHFNSDKWFPGEWKDEEGNMGWEDTWVMMYDYDKAKAAGAPCTKDCFDFNFNAYGEDETKHPQAFGCQYDGRTPVCLMTLTDGKESEYSPIWTVGFQFEDKYVSYRGRYHDFAEEENLTADGKYLTAYWQHTTATLGKTEAYYQVSKTVNVKPSLETASVSAIKNQTYTGKALKPSVTVKLNGVTLKKDVDYTAAYKNNTKVGTASVVITGIGKYRGTIEKTFAIVYPVPEKGKSYTVGSLKYKVLKSSATSGTVAVYAPAKKTCTGVSVPSSVKINGYTFKVTGIANAAFKGCTKLAKVTVGSYVSTIGKEAFYGCKALKAITIKSTKLTAAGSNALKGIYSKAVIKVPSAKLKAYTKLLKGKGQSSKVKISK